MDKWDKRFMALTEQVGSWASCHRRKVGAIIVREKRVMTTGYNGAPAGIESCVERGECLREKMQIESGTRAELCYAAHAEQIAISQAARYGISISGATLCDLREDDYQCGYQAGRVQRGLSRRVFR